MRIKMVYNPYIFGGVWDHVEAFDNIGNESLGELKFELGKRTEPTVAAKPTPAITSLSTKASSNLATPKKNAAMPARGSSNVLKKPVAPARAVVNVVKKPIAPRVPLANRAPINRGNSVNKTAKAPVVKK
jgi:hypothetical protein